MKKLILMIVLAAILMGAMGVTRLVIKNRLPYDIHVKLESLENDGVWFVNVEASEVPDADVFKTIDIPAGWYWVSASYTNPNDGYIYPCFGVADDELYDDNRAVRLMKFYKGKRALPFKPENCVIPVEVFRIDWMALAEKSVQYDAKQLSNYVY